MNKPINKKSPKKVVSRGEEHLIAKAEQLKAQGVNAFGDPTAKFNLAADINSMKEVGVPVPEAPGVDNTIDYEAIAEQEIRDEPTLEESIRFAQEKEKLVNPENQQEEQIKLSDDPAVRLGQVVEIFQKQYKGFPSKEVFVKWKRMHGDVFLLELEDSVFVYRYLKRQEAIQMQADESFQKMREDQQQDVVFAKCVLYPVYDPTRYALLPAGLVSTLVDTIQIKSMYLDARQVAMSTIKL